MEIQTFIKFIYLYNKTIHTFMLRIVGQTAEPIGLNFFYGHSCVARGGVLGLKNRIYFFRAPPAPVLATVATAIVDPPATPLS